MRSELAPPRIRSGRVIVPDGETDVLDEAPADYGLDASAVLRAMREAERCRSTSTRRRW
ncbi:MAG: hypothetical protein ACRD0A_01435 [Acidimicrobiales bacterium]